MCLLLRKFLKFFLNFSRKPYLRTPQLVKKNLVLHNNINCLELYFHLGPVVQLNRTSDSGSESRGFESRRGH